MTGCIFSLVQDTIYNNLDFHSICIFQGKSPSFNFLAWRLRRNHRQGKQKQWYGKDRFHIDAKFVIFTKIECCF